MKEGKVVVQAPICYQILVDEIVAKILKLSVSVVIVTVNMVLVYVIIWIVELIRLETVTETTSMTLKILFIS